MKGRVDDHLDRAGETIARAARSWPVEGPEQAREALRLASEAVRDARGPRSADALALAQGRLLLASAYLMDAREDLRAPDDMVRGLFAACSELLLAEEALVEAARGAALQDLPLRIDEYPAVRCAAIAAKLDCRGAPPADILEGEGITLHQYEELRAHYDDAMLQEEKRGRTGLREAFDAAYLTQLERERGEIFVEEYAKLKVASARGALSEMLLELCIPPSAMMRIERFWVAKMIDSLPLRRRVRAAIEQQRSR